MESKPVRGIFRFTVLAGGLLALLIFAGEARAQFGVEWIDLKCYRIEGEPLNVDLRLDHLNPLFRQLGLPPEFVTLFEPQQLCVPVMKNEVLPPEPLLQFIEHIDLKCYRIAGDPLNLPLRLIHLNPVLRQMGLPPEQVVVLDPVQLCVPVAKNERMPPPEVLQFIQHIDLKCYNIQDQPLNLDLRLDHLNPLFRELGLPAEFVTLREPQKFCVPVAKNENYPPPEVLEIVQWIDQKCYRIEDQPLNLDLRLDHLNPVLQRMELPAEFVTLFEPQHMCVPVAKQLPH